MPHFYDPRTGKRATPLKPDGTPYKAVPRKVIAEQGFVPGVTDIMKGASPFDGLRFYERKIGVVEACRSLGVTDPQKLSWAFQCVADVLEQPANEGTRKHTAAEKGTHGTLKGVAEQDKTVALEVYSQVRRLYPEALYAYQTEVEFANEAYGGTIDLLAWDRATGLPCAIVDWKFPVSEREPRVTEVAQLAAYAKYYLTTYDDCSIVCSNWLFGQDGRLYQIRKYNRDQMKSGWRMFQSLLRAFHAIRGMGDALKIKETVPLTSQPDVT